MKFVNKTIVIGISGGIAAFKVAELIKNLKKENIDIFVIMTKSAEAIVNPEEFQKISGHKVFRTLFGENFSYERVLEDNKVDHIELADKADIVVVVPATANIIGKLAHGVADDFLTTTLLATKAPIMICPSMNVNMWENPVVQENVNKLKILGYTIVGPDSGMLACGYEGEGRLPEVTAIEEEIVKLLNKNNSLAGKKILVTSGGTIEKIDDIRFVTNKSSGKMGAAIAEACYLRGADVILLRAKTAVLPRYQIKQEVFETAEDLTKLIKKYVHISDICFHTAAVSDFKIASQEGKISSEQAFSLQLIPRDKLYKNIKAINPNVKLIAFKAEWKKSDKELLKEAKRKLQSSDIDFLIINDVGKLGQGFNVDTNEALVLTKYGKHKKFPLQSKRQLADVLVGFIDKESIKY